MAIRKVHAEVDDLGPVDPQQMIQQLDNQLTELLGPFKRQPFQTVKSKFTCIIHAGRPGKGKQVYRVLESLGFSGVYKSITGYFGGCRLEPSGKQTIVNYSNLSGVIEITTQLR